MRKKNAFTMVELLAAMVLSALLFLAALSVIRTLGHPEPAVGRPTQGWTLAARQQLEWDFSNAVVMRQDEHGLILGGYGSLDAETLSPTHLPVTVVYSLRDIGSRRWLVREQTGLDPLTTDLNSSEIVCGDVKSFSITGSYARRTVNRDTATASQEDATPHIFLQMVGAQRLPDQVRVRIDLQNNPTPVMNSVLYLR